jgi:hypothetical protein
MNRRHILVSGVVLVVLAVWLLSRWQPERQVRVHTETLLAAAESRNFKKFASLLADNYSDAWDNDKARVLEGAQQVFRNFLALEIKATEMEVDEADSIGRAACRITIRGSGGPIGEEAMMRVNALKRPFTFTWRQRSWKPWDWELTRVEQPELQVPNW